jgi:hypothetical protein
MQAKLPNGVVWFFY